MGTMKVLCVELPLRLFGFSFFLGVLTEQKKRVNIENISVSFSFVVVVLA